MADPSRYKNKRWLRLRNAILQRDGIECQECKRKGDTVTATTVHHCDPDALDLFYDTGNLISFCQSCHNAMHDRITDELTDLGKKWLIRSRRGQIPKIKIL